MEENVEYPEFYEEMTSAFRQALSMENEVEREVKLKELEQHYTKQNWITPVLAEELQSLFPTSSDIDTANGNQKDLAKFKESMGKCCVPGRQFASCVQFKQAMSILCSKWSFVTVFASNALKCHYRKNMQKHVLHPDVTKRRNIPTKLSFDCPFCIRYSIPRCPRNRNKPGWKPRILLLIKITSMNLHHTCNLTTRSYLHAKSRAGTPSITNLSRRQVKGTSLVSILGIDCKRILLVKIGGSSITQKAELETLNTEALEWFSETIRSTINDNFLSIGRGDDGSKDADYFVDSEKPAIIVVHGAGSFGHHTAKEHGLGGKDAPPADGMSLAPGLVTGIVQTRLSVKKLNNAVVSHLVEKGINAIGISPCFNVPGLMAHGGDEYNGATLLVQSIRQTLSAGMIPVIHGDAGLYGKYLDPVAVPNASAKRDPFQSMSAGILGGDTLVKIIATHPLMHRCISKTVFLTDVEGVFTKDPKLFPEDAVLVKNIYVDPVTGEMMNEVSASGSSHEHDVTGGLEAKLGAAVTVAKTGVDVMVAKCGSIGANHAMSQEVLETNAANTCDNTAIRKRCYDFDPSQISNLV